MPVNANDDVQTHVDCLAGSGADTIVLSGITYTLTEPYDGFSGLPGITSPITIEGNDATIARDTSSGEAFRLFEVSGILQGDEVDGDLTLYNTTVTGGYVQADGGGIYSRGGPLTLIDVTVTGNTTIPGGVVSDGDGAFEIQKVALDLPPIVIPPIPNTDFTGSSSGSGCFIATAAFGSPMAKEVDLLRGFRDKHLMTNSVGRWIVAVYDELNPIDSAVAPAARPGKNSSASRIDGISPTSGALLIRNSRAPSPYSAMILSLIAMMA